jgi:hypothetical protein
VASPHEGAGLQGKAGTEDGAGVAPHEGTGLEGKVGTTSGKRRLRRKLLLQAKRRQLPSQG